MSMPRIAMAVTAVALIVVGALPSAAEAGIRLRVGGPVGVARFAMASMLSVAGLRHARMAARHSASCASGSGPGISRDSCTVLKTSSRYGNVCTTPPGLKSRKPNMPP